MSNHNEPTQGGALPSVPLQPFVQCPCCKRTVRGVKRRRTNTRYVNDERNFILSCLSCYRDEEAYWAERWAEYYADCM